MKPRRAGLAAVMFAATAGAAGSAFAQEDKVYVTLGLRAWVNEWETWFQSNNTGAANVISDTAKSKVAVIPSATVRYKDFFVSGGYFTKTSYTFPKYTESVGGAIVQTAPTAERQEIDLNFGWYFVPRVAVTLGYKRVQQDITTTTTGGTFNGVPFTTKWTYEAPTLGIAASAPIAERVALYGNGAIGPVTVTVNGSKPGTSATYSASEFGVAWQAAQNFTATLGFKYQIIEQKPGGAYSGLAQRDVTSGWVVGGLYTF